MVPNLDDATSEQYLALVVGEQLVKHDVTALSIAAADARKIYDGTPFTPAVTAAYTDGTTARLTNDNSQIAFSTTPKAAGEYALSATVTVQGSQGALDGNCPSDRYVRRRLYGGTGQCEGNYCA